MSMIIKEEILKRKADFLALCLGHNVKSLYAFGTATSNHFDHHKSDIDLIAFFDRKVDLLTESSLKNPYLIDSINKSKVLIYDGISKEIFV